MGLRSSSDATMSCVATSGFHWMHELRARRLGSLNEITGRWRLRSHTTVVPLADVDARMCCTLRFHARYVISPGVPPLPPQPPPQTRSHSAQRGLTRTTTHEDHNTPRRTTCCGPGEPAHVRVERLCIQGRHMHVGEGALCRAALTRPPRAPGTATARRGPSGPR